MDVMTRAVIKVLVMELYSQARGIPGRGHKMLGLKLEQHKVLFEPREKARIPLARTVLTRYADPSWISINCWGGLGLCSSRWRDDEGRGGAWR